jgi:geranylgeranyl pyrophosphate synthase
MINTKAAVSEATARIGAVIGGGSPDEIEILAGFGRAFGVLMTLKDEFIDMFEVEEMKNRVHGEWLPLPILYSFKDPQKAQKLIDLLKGQEIIEEVLERVLDVVLESKETAELKAFMKTMILEQLERLQSIKFNRDKLTIMLECAIEAL